MKSWLKLKNLYISVYLITLFLIIYFFSQPFLLYHLQQPPFLFEKNFILPFLCKPVGVSELISLLIVQFFYFPFWGTVVLFLFGCILTLFAHLILKQVSKTKNFSYLSFMPFAILIALLNNYYFAFELAVQLLITLIFVYLFCLFRKNTFHSIATYLFSSILVYYTSGSGYLAVYTITVILLNIQGKSAKQLFLFSISSVAFSLAIPYVVYNYLYPVRQSEIFLNFYPLKPLFLQYNSQLFYYFAFSETIIILFYLIFNSYFAGQKNNSSSADQKKSIFSLGFLLIFTALSLTYTYNKQYKSKVSCDYYTYIGNWEKASEIALKTPEYDFAINLNYNRSIDNLEKFGADFFKYPQVGKDAVFPDCIFAGETSFICMDYYYDLGYISEARHWAYESLTFFPYNKRSLRSLVKIHLINREYAGATKYLAILDKGIGNSDFVKKYSSYLADTSLIEKDEELRLKREFSPSGNEVVESILIRLTHLLEHSSKNKKAFDHLAMFYLLNMNIQNFQNLMQYSDIFYTQLPPIFEEGILIYNAAFNAQILKNYKISEESVIRFNNFSKILREYKSDKNIAKDYLYADFNTTYMYFLQFYDHNERKISLTKEKNEY